MVRVALAVTAAMLLGGATRPPDVIQHYAGGGRSISPDRKWTVWSPKTPNEKLYATAWLSGPGVRKRRLYNFERLFEVVWPDDRRFVVINDIVINSMSIKIFTLGSHQDVGPDAIERDIERQMPAIGPKIQSVGMQRIRFGSSRTLLCVRVMQAGLPAGRKEGSYIERVASFRLDPAQSSAIRIRRCPGARQE